MDPSEAASRPQWDVLVCVLLALLAGAGFLGWRLASPLMTFLLIELAEESLGRGCPGRHGTVVPAVRDSA